MSWGWKIFFVILVFFLFIMFMVFKAMNHDFQLVSENYYEKEIKYQNEIDKIQKARSLYDPLEISYNLKDGNIVFKYPESQISSIEGILSFYRPSDARMDQEFKIKPDNKGIQKISVKSLEKGLWQVKVNWSYGPEEYQEEKNIMIQ